MKFLFIHIPFLKKAETAIKSFSLTEKLVWYVLVFLFLLSAGSIFKEAYGHLLVAVPDKGGSIREGIVGTPRFINPLLVLTDADRDMTNLVFAGLMKVGHNQKLETELAESYSISSDGLVYRFLLKDAIFHNGSKLTAEDVAFTIESAKDPLIKSPKASLFAGVTTKIISDNEIEFRLSKPYSSFLESLTIGILPKRLWYGLRPEQFAFDDKNLFAVGAGPYMITKIELDSDKLPKNFTLRPFEDYVGGEPFLRKITVETFNNTDDLLEALSNGDIDSTAYLSPQDIFSIDMTKRSIVTSASPRVFGVFFNQNQNEVLLKKEVREALNVSVNRDKIINEVLFGYGNTLYLPTKNAQPISTTSEALINAGENILQKAGWKKNADGIFEKKDKTKTLTLNLDLTTVDTPELSRVGQMLKESWEKMGASVTLNVYESGDFNQNILRTRKYEAVLFGEMIGRDYDLYPFWHSSQRTDPGLNIAMYANVAADKALEGLRTSSNELARENYLNDFLSEIEKDIPAVFLYSHRFVYIIPTTLNTIYPSYTSMPCERFSYINKWFKHTNKVLSIFTD